MGCELVTVGNVSLLVNVSLDAWQPWPLLVTDIGRAWPLFIKLSCEVTIANIH